jgi:hypothetical protein
VCQFLNGPGIRYCGGCSLDLRAVVPEPELPAEPTAFAAPAEPISGKRRVATGPFDDLGDLDDLVPRVATAAGEAPSTAGGETSQAAIDGFFQRLAGEGVVELHPRNAAPGPTTTPKRAPE